MSKTDTPNDHRPLADSELDAVSGGWSLNGIPGAGATLTHAVSGFFTNGGTRCPVVRV
jgi:hypothetical protein